ncbi:Spx/MgsR family RNA polymerase-binding regulatory protein [Neopusillimonas maritima]|jgi:Spx/MgsR family transcriptional regulator|uniref:Arsenate reductase n=1 Tax=Neopusillimonas maritima TaxID=2026239 RepID=A0ABX9MVQ0_9BURK|nr:Spx/MgsR family RNA polymerase-binding regulatory protein [Neopusillimonas maritima]RII82656.1 arsenate reductase [Neopusillimonas maritima]
MSESVVLYGLKKCSTCVKAMKWLDANDVPYTFIDYREQPVDAATLKDWAGQASWDKLINRASMTWRNLPESQKSPASQEDYLALVADHPTLVKRPVAVGLAPNIVLGFSEKKYAELKG